MAKNCPPRPEIQGRSGGAGHAILLNDGPDDSFFLAAGARLEEQRDTTASKWSQMMVDSHFSSMARNNYIFFPFSFQYFLFFLSILTVTSFPDGYNFKIKSIII